MVKGLSIHELVTKLKRFVVFVPLLSDPLCPPATNNVPSGKNAWPEQKTSVVVLLT